MDWKGLTRQERIELADEIAASMKKSGTIGERIKIIRIIYGMNQSEFARYIGVSRSYLSEVENDKSKPSIEMIVGISNNLFYINGKWLLTGLGDVHIYIDYDKHGFSIIPEHNIDYNIVYNVFKIIDDKMGEGWLLKQKGSRRKADLFVYFYEIYASSYNDAVVKGGNTPHMCSEKSRNALSVAMEEMLEQGLPSIRHKPLEE